MYHCVHNTHAVYRQANLLYISKKIGTECKMYENYVNKMQWVIPDYRQGDWGKSLGRAEKWSCQMLPPWVLSVGDPATFLDRRGFIISRTEGSPPADSPCTTDHTSLGGVRTRRHTVLLRRWATRTSWRALIKKNKKKQWLVPKTQNTCQDKVNVLMT